MAGGLWTKGCVPGPGYTGLPLLLEPQPWVGRGHWEPRWEVVPPAQPSPRVRGRDTGWILEKSSREGRWALGTETWV